MTLPDPPPAPKPDSGGDVAGLALIGSAVAQLVLPVLVGVWLDNQCGWSPWGLVGGTAVGLVAGSAGFWLLYRRASRTKSEGEPRPRGRG